jgi:hypothetical protein
MYSITDKEKLKDNIINDITNGKSLAVICSKNTNLSSSEVYRLLNKDAEFRDRYVRAREQQALFYAEKMQQTIEDLPDKPTREEVERARLSIDVDKFIAARLLPKVYGTNSNTTNVQVNVQPVTGMNIVDISDSEDNEAK